MRQWSRELAHRRTGAPAHWLTPFRIFPPSRNVPAAQGDHHAAPLRLGHRSGNHRQHGDGLRRRRRACAAAATPSSRQYYPRPAGSSTTRRRSGRSACKVIRRRCGRRKLKPPTSRRSASPTSARRRCCGTARPANRCTAPSSGRIAARPTLCERLKADGRGGDGARQDRAGASTRTSPAPSCAGCSTTCSGLRRAPRPRLRHGRQLADLEAHRRPRCTSPTTPTPRARCSSTSTRREWDPELLRSARRARCGAAAAGAVERRRRHHRSERARRRGADRRHRRRPAGGAVRPGLLPSRAW